MELLATIVLLVVALAFAAMALDAAARTVGRRRAEPAAGGRRRAVAVVQ
jgi:hypothetical protein